MNGFWAIMRFRPRTTGDAARAVRALTSEATPRRHAFYQDLRDLDIRPAGGWLMALLVGLVVAFAGRSVDAQTVARGVEVFPADGIRLIPSAGAPDSALCTTATNGQLASGDDGRTLYLCDETGAWNAVASGGGAGVPGISASGTTGPTWTANTDAAAGTAESPAGWLVKAGDGALLHTVTGYLTAATDLFTFTYSGGTFAFSQAVEFAAGLTVGGVSLAGTGGAGLVGFDDTASALGTTTVQGAIDATVVAMGEHVADATNPHSVTAAQAGAIALSLATGADLFLYSTGLNLWAVKTVAETRTILDVATLTALAAASGSGLIGHDADPASTHLVEPLTASQAINELDGAITDVEAAVVAAQADATQALADAATVATDLAGTGPGEGASTVGLEAIAGLVATTVQAAIAEVKGLVDTAQATADAAIPKSLADAEGDYLRASGADTWAKRTTAETQTDLDIATLTALAAGTGGGLVGSTGPGNGWGDGSTLEARADDTSADLATIEGIASAAIPDSTFTASGQRIVSTGSGTYTTETNAQFMAATGLDVVWLEPSDFEDSPDGSDNNVDHDRYCASGECFFTITSNASANDGRRCAPVVVPTWATGVASVGIRYKVANSATMTIHLYDTDDTSPCDSNDAGTSTSYATLTTSTYAGCATWTAEGKAKLCVQCSGNSTAVCTITGGFIEFQ